MKIVTILGARPQFIKAAPVCKALATAGHHEFLVHTGQHYDENMSDVFFRELGLPKPDINLGVGSGAHGKQTGEMLARIEEVLLRETPDTVLVYGDTNSTLAGALAACKLHMPLAHIESGLRSYNRTMPEEHNRVLTDHCSNFLFCPTVTAVENLKKEGIVNHVYLVGDTMLDAVLFCSELAEKNSTILNRLRVKPGQYYLGTLHRPYNTDDAESLRSILEAFAQLEKPVVFPVHPRTRPRIEALLLHSSPVTNILLIDPVGYFDILKLEKNAAMILTDSGGMQKEAYFLRVPCVTLRPETEWVETVNAGWNIVAGAKTHDILAAVTQQKTKPRSPVAGFGHGDAASRIVRVLGERG